MKTIYKLLIIILFASNTVVAQQDPQYTHYMYNMNIVNPAYAGSKGTLSIGFLGRKQWVNISGAPQTMTLNIHAPIGKQLGAGFSVISDKVGPITETNAFADVSYTLEFSKNSNLSLGIKAGMSFFNGNMSSLVTPDGNTGVDALLRDDINKSFPNIGIGAYYYTNKFYAGISFPNMLSSEHFDNQSIARASEKMHGFITTGYVFELSKKVDLKPSLMIKTAPKSPLSIDLSANILFNKKFEAGLSYRFEDSVDFLLGFQYSRDLRFGYSYDYTLSKLKDFNSGSHEIFIQFDLNYSNNNTKSPRFF